MSKKNACSNSGVPTGTTAAVKSSTTGSANPADTSSTTANAIGEASAADAIGHASIGCDNGGGANG